jgi:hypothetical protein
MIKLLKAGGIIMVLTGFFYDLPAQDSLRLVPVVKYKLDRLLDSYFFDVPKFQSTVNKSFAANDSLKLAIKLADELIILRTKERDLKYAESLLWESRFNNIKIIHKSEEKRQLSKGRKQGAGFAGAIVVVLMLLL